VTSVNNITACHLDHLDSLRKRHAYRLNSWVGCTVLALYHVAQQRRWLLLLTKLEQMILNLRNALHFPRIFYQHSNLYLLRRQHSL